MNPYAAYLAGQDPLTILPATAVRLRTLLRQIGARVDEAPATGRWSARHIVCHLADTEVVFAFRLRQALAQDRHVIQPFDQDRWAATYPAFRALAAVDTFDAVRAWNIALIRSLPEEAFVRRLNHPERGDMDFRVLVETMAGHDLNHVRQLEAMASHD